ncbi:MAG: TetR/AcrR family transcriptional regulator [Bacilli bacterium]
MSTKVRRIRMTRTRKSLIEAFVELVNEKDFEKVTIQDLTERAQINRATFYAHYQDKYDLLDEVIGDSAMELLKEHTQDMCAFTKDKIKQLLFAVFEYHQRAKNRCRRSYHSIIPLLRTQMLKALSHYFEGCLEEVYTKEERSFYVQIYARLIYEAGALWGMEQTDLPQQKIAEKVANLIMISKSSPSFP